MKSASLVFLLSVTMIGTGACRRTQSEPVSTTDAGTAATSVAANPAPKNSAPAARLSVAHAPLQVKVHGAPMHVKSALAFQTSGSAVHVALSSAPRECALGPLEQRPGELLVHVHLAPMIPFSAKEGMWQSPAGWHVANVGLSKIDRGELAVPVKAAKPEGSFETLAHDGGKIGFSVSGDLVVANGEVDVVACPDYRPPGWTALAAPQPIEVSLAGTSLPIRGALLFVPATAKPSLVLTTGRADSCAKHEGDVELQLSMQGDHILMGGPRVSPGDASAKLVIKREGAKGTGPEQRETISIDGSASDGLVLSLKGKVEALVCPRP